MSGNSYVEFRKKQNIVPLELSNKDELYTDLMNIEHSWSGRIDTNIGNTFIMEANQLLINAIELFEMGYFDCAYYSLRSAIDISTTMVFLVDIKDDEKEKYLKNWKSTFADFPQRIYMIKKLAKEGDVFSDMYKNMPTFFNKAKEVSQDINKYVHKQGLPNLYISRNHPINQDKSKQKFINEFNQYLQDVIGIVAIMRLAVDPFPILLMDEEILYRCFDSMTEAYSQSFVDRYIGDQIVSEYKNTNMFISTKESFINEEKKSIAVFNIVKHQIIDTTKFSEISKQLHLMSKEDVFATLIACACDKIVKVYSLDGLLMYFTEKNTKRTKMSWSGLQFKDFRESKQRYNQQFDEAYISVFNFENEFYYA